MLAFSAANNWESENFNSLHRSRDKQNSVHGCICTHKPGFLILTISHFRFVSCGFACI